MEKKYTPGPWRADINIHGGRYNIAQEDGAPYTAGFSDVAVTESCENIDIQEANATLIAAAPELVEALEAMLNDYRTTGCPDPDCRVCAASDAAEAKAKAALKKAGVL